MIVRPISVPLPGEHIAATYPAIRPTAQDAGWRRRLNFWAGRALTAEALELDQTNRASKLAVAQRFVTPGVVAGLDVGLEAPAPGPGNPDPAVHFLHVTPGHGIRVDGEDVVLPRGARVQLSQIPVHYVRVSGPGGVIEEPEPPGTVATDRVPINIGTLSFQVDSFPAGHVPWAGVLVLSAAEIGTFGNFDPTDPCELDPSRDAFADERRVDASVLRICQLQLDWQALPNLAEPDNPRWRNRLAGVIFSEERRLSHRLQIGFDEGQPIGRRWDTVLRQASLFRWELLGVPIALLGTEQIGENRRMFVDRAAVARPGGRTRPRTRPTTRIATAVNPAAPDPPGSGGPVVWRARVDQFAEQLASLDVSTEPAVTAAAASFQFVPPSGFLPRSALTILNTAVAVAMQAPDRAGLSHFFPRTFNVQAVPVAVEDLDTALTASAPMAPIDLTSATAEAVRILVPVRQTLFEPELLVVEIEDPIFAATVSRFVAARQDWRQRRDFVLGRRDGMAITGRGPRAVPPAAPDPRQLEPEPVEAVAALGFTQALISPPNPTAPAQVIVRLPDDFTFETNRRLMLLLRLDEEAPPPSIEVRLRSVDNEFRHVWTERPPATPETDNQGQRIPSRLWYRYTATARELGITAANIVEFSLRIPAGRVGLARIGQAAGPEPDQGDTTWWSADILDDPPRFEGGDWTRLEGARLLAPFELPYTPVFPDGATEADRVAQVESALNPAGVTPRAVPMSVAQNGLEAVLTELEAEAAEADDFIDTNFTRSQVNLYRVRKLVLGETAAQKLLVNPAIAEIANQETATASAEKLETYIRQARSRPPVTREQLDAVLAPAEQPGTPPVDAGPAPGGGVIGGFQILNPNVERRLRPDIFSRLPGTGIFEREIRPDIFGRLPGTGIFEQEIVRPETDVKGQLPESGPILPSRGLSIGQRFTEPPATENLGYARASLRRIVDALPRMRLPLVGETVPSLTGQPVALLDLQGRAPERNGRAPDQLRSDAIAALFAPPPRPESTDEAEVTLAALDITEVGSTLLRTIERVVQARRAVITTGAETFLLLRSQEIAASARLLVLEGKLEEARQDVSVARALRLEEQERVAAVNARRDEVLQNEVKFLAYVRPRFFDPVRRSLSHWELESADKLAPVPACLREHDEPVPPLTAYLRILRDAPARWFSSLKPLIPKLDTRNKLLEVLDSASRSSRRSLSVVEDVNIVATESVQSTLSSAKNMVRTLRLQSTTLQIASSPSTPWASLLADVEQHAAITDLIQGSHGVQVLSVAAMREVEQISEVATCLHAEFAAVAPSVRLLWVERFSQFDRSASFRNLLILPGFDRLDRNTRRTLQSLVDWLYSRIRSDESDAVGFMNDLIRLCLLLASHAPVNRIIAGRIPAPTPVRPGIRIPLKPIRPDLVRVGMEFQVWQAATIVARGQVEDLQGEDVSVRVQQVAGSAATLDTSMRVQFLPKGTTALL